MNGTSTVQNRAIDFTPPRITAAVSTVRKIPTPSCKCHALASKGSTSFFATTMSAIAFAWTMFPMPKAAIAVKTAKTTPAHFALSAFSSTYIGPPLIWPLAFTVRYFTARSASEYFVAMPKTPVSHIHSTAPGPPSRIAPATP